MTIEVDDLLYRIRGDADTLISALNKAERKTKQSTDRMKRQANSVSAGFNKLRGSVAALGVTLSAGALVTGMRNAVSSASTLADTAAKLGTSAEQLQVFRFQADQIAGLSFQTADMGMQRLIRRIGDAQRGIGEAKQIFEDLGVSVDQDVNSVIADTADAIREMPNHAARLSATVKLVDSEGAGLVRVFAAGGDELARMERLARELGVVLDDKAVAAADELDKKLRIMAQQLETLFAKLAVSIGSAFGFGITVDEQITQITQQIKNKQAEIVALQKPGLLEGVFGIEGFNEENLRRAGEELLALEQQLIRLQEQQKVLNSQRNEGGGGGSGFPIGPDPEELARQKQEVADFFLDLEEQQIRASGNRVALIKFEGDQQRQILDDFLEQRRISFEEYIKGLDAIVSAERDKIREVNEEAKKDTEELTDKQKLFAKTAFQTVDGLISRNKTLKETVADLIIEFARLIVKQLILNSVSKAAGFAIPLPGFEQGGRLGSGRPVVVGENGPEVFVPNTGGKIVNNRDAFRSGGGGGNGVAVNITQNISLTPSADEAAARVFLKMMKPLQEQSAATVKEQLERDGRLRTT